MINPKIYRIRKKLDKIDDKLLILIKKRLSLVKIVLKNKQFKREIIDNQRIKIILKRIKKQSIKKKIDTKITNKIWKSMIKAFIDYEFLNFKKK
jgi:isochorismate pyruvate lyase